MVFFLIILGLLVQTVDNSIQVFESAKGMVEQLSWLLVFKHDQAVSSLIKCAFNDLIQDHLTEFLQNSVHR